MEHVLITVHIIKANGVPDNETLDSAHKVPLQMAIYDLGEGILVWEPLKDGRITEMVRQRTIAPGFEVSIHYSNGD